MGQTEAQASTGGQYQPTEERLVLNTNMPSSILKPEAEGKVGRAPKYLGKSRQPGKHGFGVVVAVVMVLSRHK